ncbi:MAG TPA: hypothetical protein VKB25_05755 [Conexibacter sp.]|nr:hypothetical protein [Conexibacter sp.]
MAAADASEPILAFEPEQVLLAISAAAVVTPPWQDDDTATWGVHATGLDATRFDGKVLSNRGSGGDDGIIAGISWAVEHRCDVISMSLGAPQQFSAPHSPVYEQLVQRALGEWDPHLRRRRDRQTRRHRRLLVRERPERRGRGTGLAETSALDQLAGVDSASAVERSAAYQLPPPESEVQ